MANHAAWYGAEAGLPKPRLIPALEFGIHLVPPRRISGATIDHTHVLQAKREQHGLLEPLIYAPIAVGRFLCHSRFSTVE